jgi:hypothetical protein
MKLLQTLLAGAALLFTAATAPAETYAAGSKVKAFSAADQHGKAWTFEAAKTRFLLVSFDMETGKKANAALAAKGKEYLPAKNAAYIANIHGMPGVGRMFALPKMRKYPHQIILADAADLLAPFPQQTGKVTVLKLDRGTVRAVRHWDPANESLDEQLK